MKSFLTFAAVLLVQAPLLDAAGIFLTENGEARAEIILSEKPLRSARLAAQELQDQVSKISGARLPILTQPTGRAVKVFVGTSAQSPVTADGLQHGAYRIATGPDWMALVGDDTDFTPTAPFAQGNSDIKRAGGMGGAHRFALGDAVHGSLQAPSSLARAHRKARGCRCAEERDV